MRKGLVSALMIALLLLPGCGEREERLQEGFDELRGAVTRAESIQFQAELSVDRDQTVETYTLAVDYDGQRTEVEILSPEILAGVRASALRGQTELAYEGVLLGVGPLDAEGITPMSAMPVMLDAMASAYVELLWWEDDAVVARLFVVEQSVLTLWMDGETMTPQAAEIARDGETVITCRITGWEIS